MTEPPSARRTFEGAALVLTGAAAIQYSATLAVGVFARVGPAAASGWRFLLGAIALICIARPKVWRFNRSQWAAAATLGAVVAFMNQCFYQAIQRVPLGTAVAIEYLGPFAVAVIGARSRRHLVAAVVAIGGVLLLTRPGSGVTAIGALFAAGAGVGWASYTFAASRVGRATEGVEGLALAMSVSAVLTLPFSMGAASRVLGTPALLGRLSGMAGLAIVLGFAAEVGALRRLRPSVAGVLMSLDPAVAFLIAWVVLRQRFTWSDLAGLALVLTGGVVVMHDATRPPSATPE